MKSIILSLSICLMVVAAAAQEPSPARRSGGSLFYFGGGPTFSKFTGDGSDNTSLLVGAQVALGMVWQLSNNLSVVPELNASMQGTKHDNPDYNLRLWMLNLPVQLRYQFAQSGFFAETGPQIGLVLDATKIENDVKTDVSNAVKETSFNWNFGLGYKITPNLVINVRVAPGLNDIAEASNVDQKQFTSSARLLFSF